MTDAAAGIEKLPKIKPEAGRIAGNVAIAVVQQADGPGRVGSTTVSQIAAPVEQ
ncbi:hypothetical protein [Stenotrophomonas ginsengisoli]|uniref:hypothetical protein n=1 Tax=Stenotrophomonas ginsengisoli TaxID=336566 RepID=UPI001FDEE031|nr:hypothetical protein [Stenotrophomonas ginsengisoli]